VRVRCSGSGGGGEVSSLAVVWLFCEILPRSSVFLDSRFVCHVIPCYESCRGTFDKAFHKMKWNWVFYFCVFILDQEHEPFNAHPPLSTDIKENT